MGAQYSDTSPKVEELQVELIRRMPAWRKLALLDDLNETVRAFAISGIKQRHPEATPERIQRLLAELMLGPELASRVYDRAR